MTKILKLSSLDFAWHQWQPRMFAFKRLHACHFIGTDRSFSLCSQLRRLFIQLTDAFDRLFSLRICWGCQPVTDQMRLEIPFLSTRAACRGEICLTMPRAMTSSAISRPVHWLMGRSLGWSQATALIWHTCWALISAGRPGRGLSLSRSATERSESAMAWKATQRLRHRRTVSGVRSNCRAIWLLFRPASAAQMMRALNTICWVVLWRRTRRCNSLRSLSLRLNGSGFGPFITGSPSLSLMEPSILQTDFGLNVLACRAWA